MRHIRDREKSVRSGDRKVCLDLYLCALRGALVVVYRLWDQIPFVKGLSRYNLLFWYYDQLNSLKLKTTDVLTTVIWYKCSRIVYLLWPKLCTRVHSVGHNKYIFIISRMKHQLDATLCRFYFCRFTLHVSGASVHHQEYLKTSTAATGTCVIVAGKSSHLLIRAGIQFRNSVRALIRRCDVLPATITHVPVAAVLVFKYSWWWTLAPETCRVNLYK